MAYLGASAQFTVAGVAYTYNLSSSHGAAGVWTVQNVNPTFTQAKAGSALDNEVQPFAEVAYSDWTGAMGLYERSTDPGDFTRPFLSSCDTSKPRQLTGPAYAKTGLSAINTTAVATTCTQFAWVDSTSGPGFVAQKSGLGVWGYWRWNETTFSWDYQRDVYQTPSTMVTVGSACRAIAGSMHYPFQTVVQYGTALYMATSGGTAGLTDISIAAAAPSGATAITGCVLAAKFFDQLVTFSLTGSNIAIQALKGSPLTVTQSIGADGTLSNNTATIYGETTIMGVVACNGVLYLFTDKSLYLLQWIEATNVFVIEPIIVGNAKFTSNPVVFNNELYIGSDNQLWHYTPGQANPDYKQVDKDGFLPSPYNGRITELHPFMQTLIAKVVDNAGAISISLNVLLRYTALGAWQFLGSQPATDTISQCVAPAIKTQDGTNFPAMHMIGTTSGMSSWAVFESGQNIRTVAAGTAYAGQGIHVTPWEYGANRTAQKQLLRSRWEMENAGNGVTGFIGPYLQLDFNNRSSDLPSFATFPGGTGLGTWKIACPNTVVSAPGDAGSALDSTGTGVLWTEYDGSNVADWHGNVAYPTYKRIRFLYKFGTSSGLAPPTLLSHSWQRLEYAFKFYVINTTIVLNINQDHPNNPQSAITTPDLLMTEVNRIQAWDYGKSIITAVGPDNVTYPCVITKFILNLTDIQPDGPHKATIGLTLQSIKLYGQAI